MARDFFDQQQSHLQHDVVRLGSMVDKMVGRAVKALMERNTELAQQVISADSQADVLAYATEDEAMTLISLQQPVATDLRRIAAALVIVHELERIGDYAEGIARLAMKLSAEPAISPPVDVVAMADQAQRMLHLALRAYIDTDQALATQVWAMDDTLDAAYHTAHRTLITFMIENPSAIERTTHWLHVLHDIERIGDRVTNICERIVYIVTGEAAYVHAPARQAS
jgi:phosphate transport system protein